MSRIFYTRSYIRRSSKFLKRHPEIIGIYEKTIRLMQYDIKHPSLRVHRLKGRLSKLSSISINLNYRLIIYFIMDKDTIIPVDIGSHDDVY